MTVCTGVVAVVVVALVIVAVVVVAVVVVAVVVVADVRGNACISSINNYKNVNCGGSCFYSLY